MANLLLIRDRLGDFYAKYEVFITPVLRFLLALITYLMINRNIGYMEALKSPVLMAGVALVNAVLPVNAILVFAAGFTVLHLYKLSIICAGVVLILFMLLFLLYFRFSPKDGIGVLLTPLAMALHVPSTVPLCFGLRGNIFSAVSVACGAIVYYTIGYVKENNASLSDGDIEGAVNQVKTLMNGIVGNRTMRVTVAAFAVTVIVVYLIRRLSVDHSRIIALAAGSIINVVVFLVGDFVYDLQINILFLLLGSIVSFAITMGIEFFFLAVDYTRTEYLQFEDDEYYYYVKAVPKLSVSAPEKKVKNISTAGRRSEDNSKVRSYERIERRRTNS
ncbi:hypothetical protein SAMN06296386_10724 [Lachnospiraceae bacterium]|nr:hypothetical protein SAMN06296386_10724 [Lachnospiraceae bacterium]